MTSGDVIVEAVVERFRDDFVSRYQCSPPDESVALVRTIVSLILLENRGVGQ